ncbi:agamous-like MADS-box protein AGL80 isoform X2 [Cornus florida]|uniref:agamous-like MADS-box protein AGL80 isoform X2 n=1 Tax=Cornus florida TaxID=4283 RepID=UPI0028975E73|nr:agamous-like MADS-box protein AGL80 isoform X2 [Cornus florida]
MVCTKVKYELIADERARRQTFRKRKAGLLKKPDVWPSPVEAQDLLQRFNSLPTMKQTGNMLNQETFLMQNVSRLNRNLEKEKRKNKILQMELMKKCLVEKNLHNVSNVQDLKDLDRLLDEKIKLVDARIEDINRANSTLVFIETGSGFSKEKKFL